ncbi:MAG: type VI secretion protein IcmF/TssM N-terminal domain-containing protein [Pseudomonadota bacterium]
MFKLLLHALKILLGLVLLAALGVGIYFLVEYLKWPWWTGLPIFLGLMGLVLAVLFLKKWFFRRREKKFVKRIVEHDESVLQKIPVEERRRLRDLQQRWMEALEVLRGSRLRKYGNPLYVLPWYLVVGETGSGKTTAVARARLQSPLTEAGPTSGLGGTRNCDWWFFESAIVLDTAGRYVIPLDEVQDKEEWRDFLTLLAKYRKREPINGLVAVIAADKLLQAGEDEATDNGRAIRRRIDEIMRTLGARFPVYILVTKMDQVPGFEAFGRFLPPELLGQALGQGNSSLIQDPEAFTRQTVKIACERFKDLRLLLLSRNTPADPGLILFPDEFAGLAPSLAVFAKALFEENPYQETPLLRGLYFSSGRQDGEVYSRLVEGANGAPAYKAVLPGTEKGLFLRDLFSKVLPPDRFLFSPLKEFVSWKKLTRNLGLSAWAGLVLCACGLLTMSFLHNLNTLSGFAIDMHRPRSFSSSLGQNLLVIDKFLEELQEMEKQNRSWKLPDMGLRQSLEVEWELKKQFCDMFRKNFLNAFDQQVLSKIGGFSSSTPGETIGAFVQHLETRINLIDAGLRGDSLEDIEALPQVKYQGFLDSQTHTASWSPMASSFLPLYSYYISWDENRILLNTEKNNLRSMLEQVANVQGTTLNWLVKWVEVSPELEPVRLADFWGRDRLADPDRIIVPSAYTTKGRKKIGEFLADFEVSLGDPMYLKERIKNFDAWYWSEYLKAWWLFGQAFDQGSVRMASDHDRRALAETMADPNNPYYSLLHVMADELAPLQARTEITQPAWLKGVFSYREVIQAAVEQEAAKSAGTIGKVAEASRNVIRQAVRAPDSESWKNIKSLIKSVDVAKEYDDALADIIPVTASRETAYKAAIKCFNSDPRSGDAPSPFHQAHAALVQLQRINTDQNFDRDNLFWRLLSGPLEFLLAYTTHEAACELQNQWEGLVLAGVQNVPEVKIRSVLFNQDGQSGLVQKFIQGPAAPFLGRTKDGYYSRAFLEKNFPFTHDFFSFLNHGAAQTQMILQEYKVSISNQPLAVNDEAQIEPYAAILNLDCASGAQQLENYNFPAGLTFSWQPDKCGTVTLTIKFSDFSLTKTYPGVNGFPSFLSDFSSGTKLFKPDDFREYSEQLKTLDVSGIKLTYVIRGGLPVLQLLSQEQLSAPTAITMCWGS